MLKKHRKIGLSLLGLALATGCGAPDQNSQPKFQVGGATAAACTADGDIIPNVVCMVNTPGHEIIVRQALDIMDIMLTSLYGTTFTEALEPRDPPKELKGSGFDSKNRIVRGNFAQDKILPIQNFDAPYRQYLWETYGAPADEHWQNGGHRQKFHGLRDFANEGAIKADYDSNLVTCQKIQNILKTNAQYAIDGLKRPKTELGKYAKLMNAETEAMHILGATTHTLQDTFSIAHVKREPAQGTRALAINEFCNWGDEFPGICNHGLLDTLGADRVWDEEIEGDIRPLKPEANIAANTTAFYLAHVYRAYEGENSLDAEMNDFFKGSPRLKSELDESLSTLETGPFDCQGL